ncbi:MAG: VanZ family protein [Oscillospiraceae bacterium]|nr:VanZ family protein [Oscillospiraceae bacterium]
MSKHRQLHICLFAVYCAVMLWLLFHRAGAIEGVDYWEQVSMSLNLKPFQTIMRYARLLDSARPYLVRLAVINLFGNIIMFIPLGFFLPLVISRLRRLWRVILATAAIITLVEITQLLTLMGSCDIDDLILNVIGAVVGYGLFRLIAK